jgi:lipid-A-disaccharide synthase
MKILVSALEHSANVHLESLLNELNSYHDRSSNLEKDTIEIVGIFNKKLGIPTVDLTELAIMGFVDVFKKLPFYFKLNSQMAELAHDVDKVLLIDSSGFNLPLAKKIKKKYPNKEIIYYILPQAWAWKKKRIPVLAKTIDHLCSIIPFEQKHYPRNAHIRYVGHPLLDQITKSKEDISHYNRVAFMPGSRAGEITKLMPLFKKVEQQLKKEDGSLEAILIIPKNFSQEKVETLFGDISMFNIEYDAKETLINCDFAFICSGTATLEASLIGVPFILAYIANTLDYTIASNLIKLNYLGLGNLMHEDMDGEALHPELIQKECTVENLLYHYNTMDRKKFLHESKKLRGYLQHGSAREVAKIILEK